MIVNEVWDRWKNQLVKIIQRDALLEGTFPLAGGRVSSYYVDIRKTALTGVGAALIARMLAYMVDMNRGCFRDVGAIGGTLSAGALTGMTLAMAKDCLRVDLDGFLVRPAAKDHGTGKQVEGVLRPGARVVLIDDVATTGNTLLAVADVVLRHGGNILGAVVVLDRLEGAGETLGARKIPLYSLVTMDDIDPVRVARDTRSVQESG